MLESRVTVTLSITIIACDLWLEVCRYCIPLDHTTWNNDAQSAVEFSFFFFSLLPRQRAYLSAFLVSITAQQQNNRCTSFHLFSAFPAKRSAHYCNPPLLPSKFHPFFFYSDSLRINPPSWQSWQPDSVGHRRPIAAHEPSLSLLDPATIAPYLGNCTFPLPTRTRVRDSSIVVIVFAVSPSHL